MITASVDDHYKELALQIEENLNSLTRFANDHRDILTKTEKLRNEIDMLSPPFPEFAWNFLLTEISHKLV